MHHRVEGARLEGKIKIRRMQQVADDEWSFNRRPVAAFKAVENDGVEPPRA
jgi:hypothetical protein